LHRALERRDPVFEREARRRGVAIAGSLVETHLRTVGRNPEARLAAYIQEGVAFGRIGIVEGAGLETEFLHRKPLVVEPEIAGQTIGRRRLRLESALAGRILRIGWLL